MTVIDLEQKKRTADENAVLGRAVAQAIKARADVGPCPSLEDLGALAEGGLPEAEAEALFGHLALCDDCDETFRITREMLGGQEGADLPVRSAWRGYLAAGLAAAAVLALAITFTLKPDRQRVALEAPAPAARPKEVPAAAAPAAAGHATRGPAAPAPMAAAPAQPHFEVKLQETPAATPGPLAKAAVPPSFARQAARQLTLAATPDLFPESEAVQGFAPRQASDARECYEMGQGLMRLTVALNLGRLDLAAEQVGQLRALRHAKLLEPDLARFEGALPKGDDPVAAGEDLLKSAQKSVGERLPYLSAGVWAEAARMSAGSRNSEYFHSQAFVAETVALRASGLSDQSVRLIDQVAALPAGKPLTESDFKKITRLATKLRDSL